MTQQDAAARVGKTQSAVANKIRLLKLSPQTVEVIRNYQLSERHARALLQLEEESVRQEAAKQMGQKHMTVAQAEAYIQHLLEESPKPRRQGMIRDVRLLCNTVERAVKVLCDSGLKARIERRQEGEELILTVRVPGAMKST
jgi:ParB family chromosome partitioning protein